MTRMGFTSGFMTHSGEKGWETFLIGWRASHIGKWLGGYRKILNRIM